MENEIKEQHHEAQTKQPYINHQLLLRAITRMIEVLNIEIEAIHKGDTENLKKFSNEKADLASFIKLQDKIIASTTDIKEYIEEGDRNTLKEAAKELKSVTQQHLDIVHNAKYFNEKLIEIISSTVKQEKSKFSGYNYKGKLNTHKPLRETPHVALNTKI